MCSALGEVILKDLGHSLRNNGALCFASATFSLITVSHGSYAWVFNASVHLPKRDLCAIFGNCDYFLQYKPLRRSI